MPLPCKIYQRTQKTQNSIHFVVVSKQVSQCFEFQVILFCLLQIRLNLAVFFSRDARSKNAIYIWSHWAPTERSWTKEMCDYGKPARQTTRADEWKASAHIINTKKFENGMNYGFNGRHLRNEKSKTDWWTCVCVCGCARPLFWKVNFNGNGKRNRTDNGDDDGDDRGRAKVKAMLGWLWTTTEYKSHKKPTTIKWGCTSWRGCM